MKAYAKINLGLHILDERPDGYHDIQTVFHRIDLWDEIELAPARSIEVRGSGTSLPHDEENICYDAALLLQKHLGVTTGVRITITKRIPVGAGLGGGSADAAAVLQSLPQMWGETLREEDAMVLALKLGSDVPYFLRNGSALATGRGEILEYFPLEIPHTILLCFPAVHIPTAWAYRNFTLKEREDLPDLKRIVTEGMRTPGLLRKELLNDFEPLVFEHYPVIRGVKAQMYRGGALFALMSGSGSAVYGLFPEDAAARAVSEQLQKSGMATFLTAPGFRP